MKTNRREFMQGVGLVLASLLTTRCSPRTTCYEPIQPGPITPTPMPTCYTVVPTPSPQPSVGQSKEWDSLRQPWHDLDRLAHDAPDRERGEQTHERLVADHQRALDKLVAGDDLDPIVAAEMQAAFEGAAYHVWRANASITCYAISLPDYEIESSSDLARQSDLLAEMAEQSAIDEATVAQAQAAIERDVAFLAMATDDQRALIEQVLEADDGTHDFPDLAELDVDVPPESVEAARILVELLLERE
jgi:hypothetical protein